MTQTNLRSTSRRWLLTLAALAIVGAIWFWPHGTASAPPPSVTAAERESGLVQVTPEKAPAPAEVGRSSTPVQADSAVVAAGRTPALTKPAPVPAYSGAVAPSPDAIDHAPVPPASSGDRNPVASGGELAASARMFAAHASLRAPEVANPDSRTNKRILDTMVRKALAQPVQAPPTPK